MKKYIPFSAALIMAAACQSVPQNENLERDCWQGLSSDGSTLDKTFVTSGRKAQIIGQQSLAFEDMGGHIQNEMGGIWMGRIKVADGFWLNVTGADGKIDSLRAQRMTVYPHYNEFDLGTIQGGIKVTSQQFASDKEESVAVLYSFQNDTDKEQVLTLDFLLNSDLSPAWYSTTGERENAEDMVEWDANSLCFTGKDKDHEWFSAWGCDHATTRQESGIEGVKTLGPVTSTVMTSSLTLKPGQKEVVRYFVGGSITSAEQAKERMTALKNGLEQEISEKELSIKQLMANSMISIPNEEIQKAYDWTIINNRWLEQDIDQLGYFLGAGAVEYPWLFGCDMSYSLQGQLCIGNFELVRSTLIQLWKTSEEVNGNGRIIHERSNAGLVYNPGNTQETAHFIMALWKYYQWTGDRELLAQIYPYCKKSLGWLLQTMDTDHNFFPEGPGIMEVAGLNAELIDVAVYTQQALECMSEMSKVMKDPELTSPLADYAEQIKKKINTEFWDEKAVSYCDFHATAADAIKAMDGAIKQVKIQATTPMEHAISFYENQKKEIAANYKPDDVRGWFSNMNWVVAVPMECGIVNDARAVAALEQIEKNNYGPCGPYLSAVERDRMMTIATSVQAMAEAKYGRIDKTVECLQMMTNCMNLVMPGTIAEMLPDYGCTFQAWTIYGYGSGMISGCFGIQPEAAKNTVTIQPVLPTGWNHMSVQHVRIGDNAIDVTVTTEGHGIKVSYKSEKPGLKAIIKVGNETKEIIDQQVTAVFD